MKRLIGLAACLGVMTSPLWSQRRPMTVDDALDMVNVGDVRLSPDGQWVFYSVSELNWKENKREKKFYRLPFSGGEPVRFIGEAGGSNFTFSPDTEFLALKRAVEKKSQIFLMPTGGGEAVQLTKHETAVGAYAWSHDSSSIFFVADRGRSKEDQKELENGADAVFVEEGPNGQRKAEWHDIWQIDLKEREEKRLTETDFRVGNLTAAPSGSLIAFTARTENRRNQGNLSEVMVLDFDSQQLRTLTDNHAPENGLIWSPDGTKLVYSAPDDREWELRNGKLWLHDISSGEHKMASGRFEGNIRGAAFSPDGETLLFGGQQGVNSSLYRLNLQSGEVTRLIEIEGTLRIAGFSKDRSRFVYMHSSNGSPPDLHAAEVPADSTPADQLESRQLTHLNAALEEEIAFARMEIVHWRSPDGRQIEGLLHLPADYVKGTRIPLMLNIHGGPAGVFSNGFSSRYHIYAGLGFASLSPNVRGSSGYNDDLLRGNIRDIGDGDYQDLMSGVDAMIERGIADPDRMGVRGWSYGGILGGRTITRTDRFKAASIGAGVYDWTSEYGPGFNHDVRLWYIGGTPWENPEGYRDRSTLTHVKEITTPTLLLHGDRDFTDTQPQSMMLYTALRDLGRTVRYIRFPREPHGFREPRHIRTRDVEEIRWMQKHVLGVEWEPWQRESDDEDKEAEETITTGESGSRPGS